MWQQVSCDVMTSASSALEKDAVTSTQLGSTNAEKYMYIHQM